MKELGVNGTETPEEEEDVVHEEMKTTHTHTIRGHQKASRSMSPAIGRGHEPNGFAHNLNGNRSSSPPRFGAESSNTRESFLNYFFGQGGKESGQPVANSMNAKAAQASMGARHVSNSVEPSIGQSLRSTERRLAERPAPSSTNPYVPEESPMVGDYESAYVSSLPTVLDRPYLLT